MNFTCRALLDEAMDDLQCDTEQLRKTLQHFKRLNRHFSNYRSLLSKWVLDDMACQPARSYRLLDVGCGGGDIALWLVEEAHQRGLSLCVEALDSHPVVLAFAQEQLADHPGVICRHADALDPQAWAGFDYVFGNHLLHHLPDADIKIFLNGLMQSDVRRFVFDDLRRSAISYYVWKVVAPLLFPRGFIASDGCISIRRAFRISELQQLVCQLSGHKHIRILKRWPFRLAIIGDGRRADC